MGVRGYYGDFVAVSGSEVRVYEDKEGGDAGREGEGRREVCPGVGICVEDYSEEGGWRSLNV